MKVALLVFILSILRVDVGNAEAPYPPANSIDMSASNWLIRFSTVVNADNFKQYSLGYYLDIDGHTSPPYLSGSSYMYSYGLMNSTNLAVCRKYFKSGPAARYLGCIQSFGMAVNFPIRSAPVNVHNRLGGHINYITARYWKLASQTPFNTVLPTASSITLTLKITSNVESPAISVFPETQSPGCGSPPAARVMFGYDFNTAPYGRWWANPDAIVVQPGTYSVTVPLTPDRWSSVFGEFANNSPAALAGFTGAKNNSLVVVGLTLGGGCFFGHGLTIDDTLSGHENDQLLFNIVSMVINP